MAKQVLQTKSTASPRRRAAEDANLTRFHGSGPLPKPLRRDVPRGWNFCRKNTLRGARCAKTPVFSRSKPPVAPPWNGLASCTGKHVRFAPTLAKMRRIPSGSESTPPGTQKSRVFVVFLALTETRIFTHELPKREAAPRPFAKWAKGGGRRVALRPRKHIGFDQLCENVRESC